MDHPLARRDAFRCGHQEHHHCVDEALAAAEAVCRGRGEKLTETRRRVLELVWTSHQPLGAYAILERLAVDGRRPAPPTVYRALDFLLEQKLVHRLASLNAYVGCTHPGEAHRSEFLICRGCGVAQEMADPAIERAIGKAAAQAGFRVEGQAVEVVGLCARCSAVAAQ